MYDLNPDTARKADQTGNRISEIGKYIGTFTQAEDLTASSGTKGVGFRFEAGGQTANLSLYTKKTDGTELMGLQTLMAIMTCLKLRNIKPVPGQVVHWDNEAKQEVTKQAKVFPDLCGKRIGVLLETEDYQKQNGGTGTRMVIAGIFQAETELTASEILDKKTKPEQLAKMVARLRHRPAKEAKQAGGAAPARQATGSGFDDMDDDIPF